MREDRCGKYSRKTIFSLHLENVMVFILTLRSCLPSRNGEVLSPRSKI